MVSKIRAVASRPGNRAGWRRDVGLKLIVLLSLSAYTLLVNYLLEPADFEVHFKVVLILLQAFRAWCNLGLNSVELGQIEL